MNRQALRSYLAPDTTLRWGLRMGIVSLAPLIWGIATGHAASADWIILSAECACWIELKGTAGQRVRVLLLSTVIAIAAGILGTLSSFADWSSILAMLVAGFVATIFKNFGERGSGLAICVFLMVILGNAIPYSAGETLAIRVTWILTGGLWNTLVGLLFTALLPARYHYRATISAIWKSVSELAVALVPGQNGSGRKSGLREIYLAEKSVRDAVNTSLHFHTGLADSAAGLPPRDAALANIRKRAALLGAHLVGIYTELDTVGGRSLDAGIRRRTAKLMSELGSAARRAAAYTASLRGADAALLQEELGNVASSLALLQGSSGPVPLASAQVFSRMLRLATRAEALVGDTLASLRGMNDKPIYRAWTLDPDASFLHPRVWWPQFRLITAVNSATLRYAIRVAAASAAAMAIYRIWDIERGYWLPFTVMVVLQPHFGATLRKAGERIAGTALGVLAGSLLLALPQWLYLKELLLFSTAVLMVTFIRRSYIISSVFITLNVMLLFSVGEDLYSGLLLLRLACTVGGAALAIIAGYVLLPVWDTAAFPGHLAKAFQLNEDYFRNTFFPADGGEGWLLHKRRCETENTNAFDSFNRSLQEPKRAKNAAPLYGILQHNVRITRDLTALNMSRQDVQENETGSTRLAQRNAAGETGALIAGHCRQLFGECMQMMSRAGWVSIADRTSDAESQAGPALKFNVHDVFYAEAIAAELSAIRNGLAAFDSKDIA